jgi:GNAT superfamily N-acetyltransferase
MGASAKEKKAPLVKRHRVRRIALQTRGLRVKSFFTMADKVQIKQFTLDDQEELLSFLRIAYPDEPRKSEFDFWKWHYLENPYTTLDDIPLWIVKDKEHIVGQLATIPVALKVGERETRAIWILDFIVLPQYRGRGLGKRLVLASGESHPTMITLGINEQSIPVFRSLNWVALGGVHRYHRLIYPGDAFGEIPFDSLRSIVNLCYAPFRPRYAQTRYTGSGIIREIRSFDDSFNELWQRAGTQWPCAVIRDSRYLEWQFRRQPGKRFEVRGLYEQNQLMGYVVLFFRKTGPRGVPPKAAITDLCYDARRSPQVVDELLKTALHLALERQTGSLVTDVLDPFVESRLQKFGFWRIQAAPQFMASTAEHPDLICKRSNWFLTRADSDISIFEQPNQ